MDRSVKTKVLNVSDFTRTFYHYGVRIVLEPKESAILVGDVAGEVKSHPAFEVMVSEDEKPPKKKKLKGGVNGG